MARRRRPDPGRPGAEERHLRRPVSAILINNRIPLPPEIEAPPLDNSGRIGLEVDPGGVLRVAAWAPGCAGQTRLADRRFVVPPALLSRLGWSPGEVLSLTRADTGTIVISSVEARRHPDFMSPAIAEDGLPRPPHFLVQAFTNSPDPEGAIENGRRAAEFVAAKSEALGRPLSAGSHFLDFGCGSGRVLRHIPALTGADVIGTDLHDDAIAWCRAHMPFGTYLDGQTAPPLPLPDNSLDAMLALSVLTHLDADLCSAWLAEWKRILRPGGIAVVTFHGEGFLERRLSAQPEAAARIRSGLDANGGLHFSDDKSWLGVFPDAYQTTYHTYDHVRRVWGSVMDLVEIVPSGGFVNAQDTAILRA